MTDSRAELKANQASGSWRALDGRLKGKGAPVRLSIEDINDEIAKAGAAAGLSGLASRLETDQRGRKRQRNKERPRWTCN
jgi:hypothetical protein